MLKLIGHMRYDHKRAALDKVGSSCLDLLMDQGFKTQDTTSYGIKYSHISAGTALKFKHVLVTISPNTCLHSAAQKFMQIINTKRILLKYIVIIIMAGG